MNSIEAPSVQLKSRSEVAPMHLTKKDHLPLETKNRENVGNDRKADSTSGNDRLHHIRRYESSSLPTTRSRPSSAPLVLPIKGDFNSRALRQRDKLHLSDKNDGAENDRRVRRLKVMALEEAIQSREVDRSTVSNVTRISHLPLSKSAESTDHIERNAKPP